MSDMSHDAHGEHAAFDPEAPDPPLAADEPPTPRWLPWLGAALFLAAGAASAVCGSCPCGACGTAGHASVAAAP